MACFKHLGSQWRRPFFFLAAIVLTAAACGSPSSLSNPSDEGTAIEGAVDAGANAAVDDSPDGGEADEADEVLDADPAATDDAAVAEDEPAPESAADDRVTLLPVSYDGSFSSTIEPILEEKCSTCHYDGGPGAFHWNLRTAQDVVDTHLLVEHVITTNSMPPWPAGQLSVAFEDDRSLRPDQVDAIVDWVADGAPIDVEPAHTVEPIHDWVGLENPDMVIRATAPYAGDLSRKDDLRCLIYDLELDEGGWVTGYEFIPDQTDVVHHAVGYLVPAEARGTADARDGEDGRPGWSCPGAPELPGAPIVVWAPGQDPVILDEGNGWLVPPGSFMVMQMHYHYEGEAPLDSSSLALVIEPPEADLDRVLSWPIFAPVEIPCAEEESGPLCDRDAALADATERLGEGGVLSSFVNDVCGVTPADFERFTDGVAQSSCTMPSPYRHGNLEVDSFLLHMHQTTAWSRLTLNQGTSDEQILVDIPAWDFDWQYKYIPVDKVVIEPDDTLTLECAWDRSLRDPSLEPAWILWADGSNDEMCVAYLDVR